MIGLRNAASAALLLAGVLGMASCDKAKLAVNAAREKFRGAPDPDAPATPGGDVAPDMAAQVDSAAEGVRFRRDLPFPTDLAVKLTQRRVYENARLSNSSALGVETSAVNSDWELDAMMYRQARRVGIVIVREVEIERAEKEAQKADGASTQVMGGGLARIDFDQGPKGWAIVRHKGRADFQTRLREQHFQPAMGRLVAHHGLAPRQQWFSASRRWAAGDRLVLERDSLKMIFPGECTGKVTLVYEVNEPIDGHPCGRFAVSGAVTIKGEVTLGGKIMDREMSIKSGKVWCSLLHPMVLREEYDSVVTTVENTGGSGPATRVQGGVKIVNSWSWQKTAEG